MKVRAGLMQETLLHRTFRDFAQVSLRGFVLLPKQRHNSLDARHRETEVVLFHGGLISRVDHSGHARLLPLHPGLGSESAALTRPLHGAFWRTHVPPLVQCL